MSATARGWFESQFEGPTVPLDRVALVPLFIEPVPREAPQCPVPGCDRDIVPPHDHDHQEQQ